MLISSLGIDKKKPSKNVVLDFINAQSKPATPKPRPAQDTRTIEKKLADPEWLRTNSTPSELGPGVHPGKSSGQPAPSKKQKIMVAGKSRIVTFDSPPSGADINDAKIYYLKQDNPELGKQYDDLSARIRATPKNDPSYTSLLSKRNNLVATGKADDQKESEQPSILAKLSQGASQTAEGMSEIINKPGTSLGVLQQSGMVPGKSSNEMSLAMDTLFGGSEKGRQNLVNLYNKHIVDPVKKFDAQDKTGNTHLADLAGMGNVADYGLPQIITSPKNWMDEQSKAEQAFTDNPGLLTYLSGAMHTAGPALDLMSLIGGVEGGVSKLSSIGRKVEGVSAGDAYNAAIKAKKESDIASRTLKPGQFKPQSSYSDYQITGTPNLLGSASKNPKPLKGFKPQSESGYVNTTLDGPIADVLKNQHPDSKYPNWRQRTEGVISAIDKHISEGVGSGKKKGLLNLKSDLNKSLRDGNPHQGIIDEYPKQPSITKPYGDTPVSEQNKFAPPESIPAPTKAQAPKDVRIVEPPKNKFIPPSETVSPISTPKIEPVTETPKSATTQKPQEAPKVSENATSGQIGSNKFMPPEPVEGNVTGIANRHTEKTATVDRHKSVLSSEEARVEGRKAVTAGEIHPDKLAQDILDKPRPTTDIENGVLWNHRADLHQQEGYLDAKIARTKDPEELIALGHAKDDIQKRIDANKKATVFSGTETSSSFHTRQGDIPINEASESEALAALRAINPNAPAKSILATKRASKAVRDANINLVDAEERASQTVARDTFTQDAIQAKKDVRAIKHEELDKEFKELEKQAAKHLGQLNAGIPIELVPIVGKMVRNRIVKGALKLEDAIEPVWMVLKDRIPGITKRDVMDAYSGYGKGEMQGPPSPKQVETQLKTAIKSQASAQSKLEDAKQGIFQPTRTKTPAYTQEVTEARKARDLANQQAYDLRQKSIPKTGSKWLEEAGRTMVMTSVNVFGKLAGATAGHSLITPIEEAIAPMLGKVLKGGGTEVRASVKAETKALEQFLNTPNASDNLTRTTLKDTMDKLTKGYNELDLEARKQGITHGENQYNTLLNYLHNSHGAMKTPLQRASFAREYQKVLEEYAKKGATIDSRVRSDAFARAYAKSKEAILMNEGPVVKKVSAILGMVPGSRYVVPIVRVPINYAGRTLEYTHGVEYAAVKYLKEAVKAKSFTLPAEQQAVIARALKRGMTGKALMAMGAFMPKEVFNIDEDGRMVIGDKTMPNALSHIPWLEAIKMGALWRDSGYTQASHDTAKDIAKHTPASNLYYDAEGLVGPRSGTQKAAQTGARILTGGGLQILDQAMGVGERAAGRSGKKAPEDWLQELYQHIPWLRDEVPDK